MKIKFGSLVLMGILVFSSLAIFGKTTDTGRITVSPSVTQPAANALWLNYNSNMEYCTVVLDNPNSNLNVRTWEGRIIGKLRHGTRVWVNEYSDNWARVSVKRGRSWVSIGWVDSSYLSC
ncbi:MAG: hypothetical protein JSS81_20555 [Acidobacteria bacterium]|nr:hypothetical protein [Acidobacteriota bacterium]